MDPGAGSRRRRNRFDLRSAAGRHGNGWRNAPASSPRFLFYSNECVGLGHLRRCLRLARGLTEANPESSALIVTGSPAATSYSLPPRVDLVKLPALARDEEGHHLPDRLAVDVDVVSRVRSQLAVTVASEFDPTVAVIDKTPLGLRGELVPVLELLETRSCRLVLGLRDVEDGAESLRRRWTQAGVREALERWYDAILVYGPRASLDALDSLGWRDLGIPVHHVGYVGPRMADRGPSDLPAGYLLATAGGGVDGYPLLSQFVEALHLRPLPCPAVVVAGPLMPGSELARLRERAAGLDVRVDQFRGDMDDVIAGARAVVSMAGYNTVSELLIAGKPGLIVPGLRPSREQTMRAEMLAASGMVHVLDPQTLDPEGMRAALDRLLESPPPRVEPGHYSGTDRATAIVTELAEDKFPDDSDGFEAATGHRQTRSGAGSGLARG
jgi:predicted glycosyltransferase